MTTTGAPVMYSAGPALHNGTTQQHSSQSQQQIAYQIAAAAGQPPPNAGPGVVAQQPAQLVQRPSVLPQVRHHPYRN